jgi:hypothetical protein
MLPKKDSSSSNQNGNQIQIIFAVIGLVSALGVAYLGYRQATDPQRFSVSLTTTAAANQVPAPATNTLAIIPTDNLIPTSEPSATATTEVVFTPTPQPLISSTCLFSDIWDYTPRKTIPTDGCWKVKEFTPVNNGVQMGIITVPGSGEQQRGFYALLNGDADVQFAVRINTFESQTISPDKTKRSNLALGIVEGSPFNYYNGIYIYYYASKPEASAYEAQVTKEQDVAYNEILSVDREQKIRFLIQGKRLTVYIDGTAINAYTLTFNQNAFYFGYRLFENTDLSSAISDLTFIP